MRMGSLTKGVVAAALLGGGVLAAPSPALAAGGIVTTIAGTGTAGHTGNGGPATAARLNEPRAVAQLPDGSILVDDNDNNRIRRISTTGIISNFAGDGSLVYDGEGGFAVNTGLGVSDIAVTASGHVLVADVFNCRVLDIWPNGIISTVAGNGTCTHAGDGGQATAASLYLPHAVAVGTDGSLYISEEAYPRVRKVAPDGVITTIAGTGIEGYSGDGGPAVTAQLRRPGDLAITADGSLLIADTENARIRRVSTAGIITTFAGTGIAGAGGEGGLATATNISDFPQDVVVGPDGSVYFTEYGRVRQIDPSGVITTYAGAAASGSSGDGGPALAARFSPSGLALLSDGSFLVSEASEHRVRRIAPPLVDLTPPETTIDAGPADGSRRTDATATFEFSADEDDVAFECSIDGSSFELCQSPHSTGSLGIGAHTFAVRAEDAAGNADPTPAARTWTVTAPTSLRVDPSVLRLQGLRLFLTMSATLTRADTGAPLGGQIVRFTAGGRPVCTAVTNGGGVAACGGLPAVLAALGGHQGHFDGDSTFEAASGGAGLIG